MPAEEHTTAPVECKDRCAGYEYHDERCDRIGALFYACFGDALFVVGDQGVLQLSRVAHKP